MCSVLSSENLYIEIKRHIRVKKSETETWFLYEQFNILEFHLDLVNLIPVIKMLPEWLGRNFRVRDADGAPQSDSFHGVICYGGLLLGS